MGHHERRMLRPLGPGRALASRARGPRAGRGVQHTGLGSGRWAPRGPCRLRAAQKEDRKGETCRWQHGGLLLQADGGGKGLGQGGRVEIPGADCIRGRWPRTARPPCSAAALAHCVHLERRRRPRAQASVALRSPALPGPEQTPKGLRRAAPRFSILAAVNSPPGDPPPAPPPPLCFVIPFHALPLAAPRPAMAMQGDTHKQIYFRPRAFNYPRGNRRPRSIPGAAGRRR